MKYIFILLFFFHLAAHAGCLDDATATLQLHEFTQTASAIEFLVGMDQKLLSGQKQPGWEDLQNITNALEKIRAEKRAAIASGKIETYIADLKTAASHLKNDEQWMTARGINKEVALAEVEGQSLASKTLFWDYIHKINKELPKELRIAIQTPDRAVRFTQLEKDGIALVAAQDKRFDKVFEKSSPFASWSAYRAAALKEAKADEKTRQALSMLDNEDVEFAMARPNNARWWVKRVGFQNQHVTGTSNGYRGREGRNAVEAGLLGKTYEEYAPLSDELKPRYGYLHKSIKEGSQLHPVHYGDDYFFFDKNKLRERITFTFDDSLNPTRNYNSDWTNGVVKAPESYQYDFIPWSRRSILATVMSADSSVLRSGRESKIGIKPVRGYSYIELQYWGHLDLSLVKKFVFTTQPPDGEFLEELVKHNIEIYDATAGGLMKRWKP